MASSSAADDPSDLFSQLDALEHAEPLSAEDDLILRLQAVQAVSKVRGSKGKARKQQQISRSPPKVSKSIAKKRRKKSDRMEP